MDTAFFVSSYEPDRKRLDNRNQSHIGIGCHCNRSHIVRTKHLRYKDRGRAVRSSDDTDGCSVFKIKAQQTGDQDCSKDTKLCGRTEQKQHRLAEQGAKINHSSDTDKQQDRHSLRCFNSGLKKPLDDTRCRNLSLNHLVDHTGIGKIHQNCTKSQRQQQRRLIFLFDRQPYEHNTHHIHDQLLPGDCQDSLQKKTHRFSSFCACIENPLFFSIHICGIFVPFRTSLLL